MVDNSDLLLDQQRKTNQFLERIGDLLVASGKPDATGKAARAWRGFDTKDQTMFGRAVNQATKSVQLMHSEVENFTHHLGNMIGGFAAGSVVTDLVSGALNLGRTFTKMADIGQSFNGSMFEMAAQAGASGLSLDEFSRLLSKNSTATAVLGQEAGGTASNLGLLQASVRNTLHPLGFYGMSLNQLIDMTSDYAESLRLTGQLQHFDSAQQSKAISQLAGDVTMFASATGKSREAILKGVNDAYRETSAAMRMAARPLTELQNQAYGSFTALFSSMPGIAGEQLPKFFAQLYGTGNAYFTELGKTAIEAGLGPQFNGIMSSMVNSMQRGEMGVDRSIDAVLSMRDLIVRNRANLQAMWNAGNQQAGQMLAFAQSLNNLSREQMKANMARQKEMDGYTKAIMTFESDFHKATGTFRTGFYKSFASAIAPFKTAFDVDPDAADKGNEAMRVFSTAMDKLGTAMGLLLGTVFSERNIKFIGTQLDIFAGWIIKVFSNPMIAESLEKLEGGLITFVETIGWLIEKIHGGLSYLFGEGMATLIMAGVVFFRKAIGRFLFGSLAVNAGVVRINTGMVTGLGHGGGLDGGTINAPGQGEMFGGPGSPHANIRQAFKAGGWRSAMSHAFGRGSAFFGGMGGLVVSAFVGMFADHMVDKLSDEVGKDSTFGKVLDSGYVRLAIDSVAGIFGPKLLLGAGRLMLSGIGRGMSMTGISGGLANATTKLAGLFLRGLSGVAGIFGPRLLLSAGQLVVGGISRGLAMTGISSGVANAATKLAGLGASWSGLFLRGLSGTAAYFAVEEFGNLLPDFEYKDTIMEVAGTALGAAVTLFGPAMLSALVSAVTEYVIPGMLALLAPEILIPALVAAALAAVWKINKNKQDAIAQSALREGYTKIEHGIFAMPTFKDQQGNELDWGQMQDRVNKAEGRPPTWKNPIRQFFHQDEPDTPTTTTPALPGGRESVARDRADVSSLFANPADTTSLAELTADDLRKKMTELKNVAAEDAANVAAGTATADAQDELSKISKILETVAALLARNNDQNRQIIDQSTPSVFVGY